MEVQIHTDQIKVLQDFFNDLSEVDQRKVFMASFKKAAKPLIAQAKSNIPHKTRHTGQLARSIKSFEEKDNIAIIVGANKSGKKSGWYADIVERGSFKTGERFWRPFRKIKWRGMYTGESRGWKRKRKSTGVLPPHPFMEDAFNETAPQMYDSMAGEWYKEIDRLIAKANKKLK